MSQFKYHLPNVRKTFIPDPGYTIIDCDLAQADAQIVAWDADDDILKDIFRTRGDLHTINAEMIWGKTSDTKLAKTRRQLAKAGVHLTNYGGRADTCARALGITRKEASDFQERWFDIHPAIKQWHRRIELQLATNRTITNRFGYRRIYFDRMENSFTEALAWIPQSTVALVITKAMNQLHRDFPFVEQLFQVHDSLVVQVKTSELERGLRAMHTCMHQVIPYEDPLVIPSSADISSVSWGDVELVAWPTGCN